MPQLLGCILLSETCPRVQPAGPWALLTISGASNVQACRRRGPLAANESWASLWSCTLCGYIIENWFCWCAVGCVAVCVAGCWLRLAAGCGASGHHLRKKQSFQDARCIFYSCCYLLLRWCSQFLGRLSDCRQRFYAEVRGRFPSRWAESLKMFHRATSPRFCWADIAAGAYIVLVCKRCPNYRSKILTTKIDYMYQCWICEKELLLTESIIQLVLKWPLVAPPRV